MGGSNSKSEIEFGYYAKKKEIINLIKSTLVELEVKKKDNKLSHKKVFMKYSKMVDANQSLQDQIDSVIQLEEFLKEGKHQVRYQFGIPKNAYLLLKKDPNILNECKDRNEIQKNVLLYFNGLPDELNKSVKQLHQLKENCIEQIVQNKINRQFDKNIDKLNVNTNKLIEIFENGGSSYKYSEVLKLKYGSFRFDGYYIEPYFSEYLNEKLTTHYKSEYPNLSLIYRTCRGSSSSHCVVIENILVKKPSSNSL